MRDGARRERVLLLANGLLLLVLSAVQPYDGLTWILETAPILIAIPILLATSGTFPLTPLAYRFIFVHALILMLGAHYSYERVPIGFWAQDLFALSRNHYDRLGHIAQGFFPAIIVREVLLRRTPLRRDWWLVGIVTSICLAVSAVYELLEWAAALALGSNADAFLATQGDPWDTQWDMFLALLGALAAQVCFARLHDEQLSHQLPAR